MSSDALLAGLTDPQREAVLHRDGPLLVLAGAGSGKTRVITHRAAHLARTAARPERILAITFTNKAAGEMRDRIRAIGVDGAMTVCTFHSLGARLLREFGRAVGLTPGFSIFDEADRRHVVRQALGECGLRSENWQPRTVEEAISDAKSRMQTPAEMQKQATDFGMKTLARIYAAYQGLLTAQNACDFDDLLMYAAGLLEQDESIRSTLSDRYRYLLIDEYQDTNHAQYVIASLLASSHRNICATGDPDQSIYAWRGANIHNILDFETDYPDAKVVRLEQNFRSTGSILSAASALIAHNVQRKHKRLWTDGDHGPCVRVWTCDDEQQEAEQIARAIRDDCDQGGRAGDVAVFYRVNSMTRVLEERLLAARIPYQIARGVEFYERKEIKDVLAYLRAIVNPADEVSLLRAMSAPSRGIGGATIGRLRRFAAEQGVTLSEAIARAEEIASLKSARKKIAPFAALLDELRELPRQPVAPIVEAVLKRSGLDDAFCGESDEQNERLANVAELVSAARQYDGRDPDGSLNEWLHEISLTSDVDAVDLSGGTVTLLTLHAAKGLEFPVGFLAGLEEGNLPHRRSIGVADSPEEIEEERRLCFVGMTRARRRLTLSHALYRMVRGVTERTIASRFLRELPVDEVEHESFGRADARSTAHLAHHDEGDVPFEISEFCVGRRVRHEEYGDGEVLGIERRGRSVYIRVHFDDYGPRSFALEHAPLVALEC